MPALVSVVIPNYNYAQYLPEAIESVLNQTYPDIEVIYIDDGSTDNSLEIASRYDIMVLAQRNQGQAAARNNAVQFANGKYLFFLDADDLLLPEAIGKMVRLAESADANVGFIYGQMDYFGFKSGIFMSKEYSPEELAKGNYICVSSLIEKEWFLKSGGFDKGFVEGLEDHEFYVRLLHMGVYGKLLAEPVIRCRKHRPPKKKFINRPKNIATVKLFYKYPKFFRKKMLRRPLKYLVTFLLCNISMGVNKYGPGSEMPRVSSRKKSSCRSDLFQKGFVPVVCA